MEFEFDAIKSNGNKEKHGLNFIEAQKLWNDPDRIEIRTRFLDEPRTVLIGKIEDKHWSAIFTVRNNKIRLISVRWAREYEKKNMKAESFDKKFDDGEDVSDFLDIKNAKRPDLEQKRVNVDFPIWMVKSLDKEAKRIGVTRQSIIKMWIAERFEQSSV